MAAYFVKILNVEYVTVKEASETLGVTVGRVHQFINSGRLPAEKLGFQYVIKKDDVKRVEQRKPGRPKNKAENK